MNWIGHSVAVGVFVAVLVGVFVGVRVGVLVRVLVDEAIGGTDGVMPGGVVGVFVGVSVGVSVGVFVGGVVGVLVGGVVGVTVAVIHGPPGAVATSTLLTVVVPLKPPTAIRYVDPTLVPLGNDRAVPMGLPFDQVLVPGSYTCVALVVSGIAAMPFLGTKALRWDGVNGLPPPYTYRLPPITPPPGTLPALSILALAVHDP